MRLEYGLGKREMMAMLPLSLRITFRMRLSVWLEGGCTCPLRRPARIDIGHLDVFTN